MQASFEKPKGFKKDYFVPNFGPQDYDVADTQGHIAATEAQLGHTMSASFKTPKGNPKDYFVPNFGPQDVDVVDTQAHIAGTEAQLGHTLVSSFKAPKGFKKDYFVPNFGLDHEVLSTQSNIGKAETKLAHVWNPDNAGIDAADNGSYSYAAVQLAAESDPICDSSGCNQYKHKKKEAGYDKDYPVPDLGVDRDILGAHEDLAVAEGMLKHKLIMGTDESKAKWKNPAKKTDYDYSPKLDKDMHDAATNLDIVEGKLGHKYEPWTFVQTSTSSDPICDSSGCNQYKHKKKEAGYDKDYPVPDLGVDRDILGAHEDLAVAEGMLKHKLIMGTDESKAKWKNPAKKTDYDYSPKLDRDMHDAATNLDLVEGKLGHKYEPWTFVQTDASSDPICSSAGCGQYKHPKNDPGYDMDYPVANWGDKDTDIVQHDENLPIAEKIVGHHWNFVLEKPPLNPAKKTLYDYSPKLEGEMTDAKVNLDLVENKMHHKYAEWMGLQTDVESDPICASSGCWHSDWFKANQAKIEQYPNPEADGLSEDVKTTLANEKAASEAIGYDWDPWAGASNKPFTNAERVVRNGVEAFEWTKDQ